MKILVIGDSMLDKYLYGDIERISPEAPVPIMKYKKEEYRLGGAANVAVNLSSMGLNVTLASIVGKDKNGQNLKNIAEKYGLKTKFFVSQKKDTILKNRFVARNQQVLRLDKEENYSEEESMALFELIKDNFSEYDSIIISDYDKGTLSNFSTSKILKLSPKTKIFLDPKEINKELFKGAFLIKPNYSEFEKCTYSSKFKGSIYDKIRDFISYYQCDNLLLTMGDKGMILGYSEKNTKKILFQEYDALAQDVFDVTGAGDTVMATLVGSFSSGKDLIAACEFANLSASKAVTHFGNYITDENVEMSNGTVFTNGCFDVIHEGHIKILKEAANLGRKLIVGLNSDKSVKSLKGDKRPINNQSSRKKILESIKYVDEVIIFDEKTPERLVKEVKPNVIVKGGDYEAHEVIGGDFVVSRGGKIVIIPTVPGFSSTKLINNLKNELK